jgi:uncharacterized protein (DUF488 family)
VVTENVGGPVLYTVGHSNYTFERFLELLRAHGIEVVVDVRSQPYSKYTPYFDHDQLQKTLPPAGVRYLFLGKELGGRPEGKEFYDGDGHVVYARMAQSELFQSGVARLEKGIGAYKVAVMCGEEDPTNCHRRLLITRVMQERGWRVMHIRGDGRLQPEEELAEEERRKHPEVDQISMFPQAEEETWKSTRSVSPRKPQSSSSEP